MAIPLWINGRAYLTVSDSFYDVLNPASGEAVRRVPLCGAAEAAEIMGCHWTWPPRAARNGDIIGRILHNGRTDKAEDRAWIFSRRSCEKKAAKAKAEIHAGTKVGRPRRGIQRKTLAS